MIVYEALVGFAPYPAKNILELMQMITQQKINIP
jgi:hypothetical protein